MGSWDREDSVLVAVRWQWLEEWAVPHSHVVDKSQEGYLGSEQSQP